MNLGVYSFTKWFKYDDWISIYHLIKPPEFLSYQQTEWRFYQVTDWDPCDTTKVFNDSIYDVTNVCLKSCSNSV